MASNKPHITIRMMPGLLDRVEQYREQLEAREKVSISRTAAVVSLIEKGLSNDQGQTECQECGSTDGVRLEHHPPGRPDRDIFLCRKCREG